MATSSSLSRTRHPVARDRLWRPWVHQGVKELCAGCSVREECLEAAMADDELGGLWGGTTEGERREMRANRGVRSAPSYEGRVSSPDSRDSAAALA